MSFGFVLNEEPVFAEIANQRMVLFESDLSLDFLGGQEGFDIAQTPGSLGQGPLAGPIDSREGMAVDQADQPHQCAQAADATIGGHSPRPLLAAGAQVAGSFEPVIQVGLEAALATADSPGIGELTRLESPMNLDLL